MPVSAANHTGVRNKIYIGGISLIDLSSTLCSVERHEAIERVFFVCFLFFPFIGYTAAALYYSDMSNVSSVLGYLTYIMFQLGESDSSFICVIASTIVYAL